MTVYSYARFDIGKEILLTGKPYQGKFSRDEIICMQEALGNFDSTSQPIRFYHLRNNTVKSAFTKSRTTKRNNSCVSYIARDGKVQRGIYQKLFCFKQQPQHQFCLPTKFTVTPNQPCKDSVTNAQLQNHLVACDSR